MTHDEWMSEGRRLFGDDVLNWKFVCPACGHIASALDYKNAGAPSGAIGFSCIGRYLDSEKAVGDFLNGDGVQPCNYAGGGLIGLNPVEVDGQRYFAFAANPENGEG